MGGCDLDSCLEEGALASWAAAILRVLDTYAEISPSGGGLKAFFYIAAEDVRPFLDRIGVAADGWGCRRAVPGEDARDHGAAVECYLNRRYFAVTDNRWSGAPNYIRLLEPADLDRLAALIPRLGGNSKTTGTGGSDRSRSAAAFRLAKKMKAEGKTFEQWVGALEADPDCRDWLHDKGDERQLRRTWDRAGGRPIGGAPAFSEEALALELAAEHDGHLRYTAIWSRWFLWADTHWRADETLTVFDLVRELCRTAGIDPRAAKIGRAIASAKTVAAVASLARSDRRIATDHRDWDSDPWHLAGAVSISLETGATRPPAPEDLCTKIAGAAPLPGGCPLWLAFLDRVMAGDVELQRYLQRVAGYCLTGSTREHVMFFLYGTGANGKSVFTGTLRAIWGDYAVVAPMETFIETQNDRHPTELAMMRGARLVVAQETERGRRWAESKIKQLTGGDPISARFMRQDFFEYTPQFKLMIAGNHKPGLRGVDEAIRRRMHLIPFTVTIPAAERDKHLAERLQAEWGGILRWAIDGCLEWQRIGLAPPQAVLDATRRYLHDEDAHGQWIDERCAIDPIYSASSSALYQDWKSWSEANGERPGSQRRFSQVLEARGFERRRERTGAMFFGIALRP